MAMFQIDYLRVSYQLVAKCFDEFFKFQSKYIFYQFPYNLKLTKSIYLHLSKHFSTIL